MTARLRPVVCVKSRHGKGHGDIAESLEQTQRLFETGGVVGESYDGFEHVLCGVRCDAMRREGVDFGERNGRRLLPRVKRVAKRVK